MAEAPLDDVLEALGAAWRSGMAADPVAAPHLATTLARLDGAKGRRRPMAARQPVTDWIGSVTTLSKHPQSAALAAAVGRAAGAFGWHPAYPQLRGDPRYAAFLDGYSYADLAGPQGPLVTPDLGLFVTIQAPGVTYPAHRHQAFEVYYVIAGRAEWQRGDEPWTVREPGTFIVHAAMQSHAMRTGAEPLLAAAVWLDHLDGPSLMVET